LSASLSPGSSSARTAHTLAPAAAAMSPADRGGCRATDPIHGNDAIYSYIIHQSFLFLVYKTSTVRVDRSLCSLTFSLLDLDRTPWHRLRS
jgi:hypothetical protein